MRLNPNKISKHIFKSMILILGILMGNTLKAQLNGNYTIGGSSGPTNFTTWSAFASATV